MQDEIGGEARESGRLGPERKMQRCRGRTRSERHRFAELRTIRAKLRARHLHRAIAVASGSPTRPPPYSPPPPRPSGAALRAACGRLPRSARLASNPPRLGFWLSGLSDTSAWSVRPSQTISSPVAARTSASAAAFSSCRLILHLGCQWELRGFQLEATRPVWDSWPCFRNNPWMKLSKRWIERR